jgi:hypothetical protein
MAINASNCKVRLYCVCPSTVFKVTTGRPCEKLVSGKKKTKMNTKNLNDFKY